MVYLALIVVIAWYGWGGFRRHFMYHLVKVVANVDIAKDRTQPFLEELVLNRVNSTLNLYIGTNDVNLVTVFCVKRLSIMKYPKFEDAREATILHLTSMLNGLESKIKITSVSACKCDETPADELA